jgi:UDP:flavonoid glycosyltransferase YjiC (YdhE family)
MSGILHPMDRTGKRLLLATLGSLGDLHPMVALGRGLAARGHDVTIASSPAHGPRVVEAGLGFAPIRPDLKPEDPELARRVLDPVRGPAVLLRELVMGSIRASHADLDAAAHACGAELLVAGEVVYAASLVAHTRGIPWVAALLQPFAMLSAHDPAVMPNLPFARAIRAAPLALQRALLAAARRHTRGWFAPLDALRAELGLPRARHPLFDEKFSPWLNLALFPRELAAPQPDWPAPTLQPGFLYYDGVAPDTAAVARLSAFLDAGDPPIVFTLGSSAVQAPGRFYEESLEAARRLGRRALLLAGRWSPQSGSPADRALHAPAAAAFDYAPHSLAFPRACAIVHQGGIGTTAQALRAGRPQLVVPFAFDQPDNAARIERLGVGRAMARRRYDAARAARVIGELLADTGVAGRAAALGATLSAGDGLAAACDAIEAVLARSTVSRPAPCLEPARTPGTPSPRPPAPADSAGR